MICLTLILYSVCLMIRRYFFLILDFLIILINRLMFYMVLVMSRCSYKLMEQLVLLMLVSCLKDLLVLVIFMIITWLLIHLLINCISLCNHLLILICTAVLFDQVIYYLILTLDKSDSLLNYQWILYVICSIICLAITKLTTNWNMTIDVLSCLKWTNQWTYYRYQ